MYAYEMNTMYKMQQVVKQINSITGHQVTLADYAKWLNDAGGGDEARFSLAVALLLGQSTVTAAHLLGVLPALLEYALHLGPRIVGPASIDLHQVLINYNSPALQLF